MVSNKYKKRLSFSREAEAVLQRCDWLGNVRELENDIQGLIITRDSDRIDVLNLPRSMRGEQTITCPEESVVMNATNSEGRPLKEIMAELERKLLQNALAVHGSVSEVARVFQVNRTTIFRKMNRNP